MKSSLLLVLLAPLAPLIAAAQQLRYPSLGGAYDVGTTVLELVDHSRPDVYAPTPSARKLMISIFYPAENRRRYGNCSLAAVFPPATAALVASELGLPADKIAALTTNACRDAPFLKRVTFRFPVVLFSPGFAATRLAYSAMAEQLASYGYVVVTVDHPYTAGVVEYLDGSVIYLRNVTAEADFETEAASAQDTRQKDMSFVLDQLQRNATASPVLADGRYKIDSGRVGIFGHSFGGATSVEAMLDDSRFACGANLDGPIFGPAANRTLDRPLLLMTAADANRSTLIGWNTFWPKLRGFKREISVAGTVHLSLSDLPVIVDLLGLRLPQNNNTNTTTHYTNATNTTSTTTNPNNTTSVDESFSARWGSITGSRWLEIHNAYLDAFFAMCFKGRPNATSLLSGPDPRYPEVSFAPQ